MDTEVKIGTSTVTRDTEVAGLTQTDAKDPVSFMQELSKYCIFDTGLLPLRGSGVLAIRKGLNHEQIVFQHEPGMYYIWWGAYEGDPNAKVYHVAQPWRIVIGDMVDGQLLGAKTFYSPVPVQTLEQQLYLINLPNTNIRGYTQGYANPSGDFGNALGWICLYHTQDWSTYSMGEKIRALVERASGVETYNDNNMKETDGARYYQGEGKPDYVWNPTAWAAKSLADGVEWTLDPDLWIPAHVKSMDVQIRHVKPEAGGVPLTLEMAMYGNYSAYYTDKYLPKPVNALARTDLDNPSDTDVLQYFQNAFVKSKKAGSSTAGTVTPNQTPPSVPTYSGTFTETPAPPVIPAVATCDCNGCADTLPDAAHDISASGLSVKKLCEGCYGFCYKECTSCGKYQYDDDLQPYSANGEDNLLCTNCQIVLNCKNCGEQYLQQDVNPPGDQEPWVAADQEYCSHCESVSSCSICLTYYKPADIKEIAAKSATTHQMENVIVCVNCIENHTICGCGYIKNQDDTGVLGDTTSACGECIAYKDDGMPYYAPKEVSVTL